MTPTEESFREVEQLLDSLVAADTSLLAERGVTTQDESERQYHYKSPYLCWRYRFATQRSLRSPEIGSITISLTFSEPADTDTAQAVDLWLRQEIFQPGAKSRWESTEKKSLTLEEIKTRGIGRIVTEAIAEGFDAMETVVKQSPMTS